MRTATVRRPSVKGLNVLYSCRIISGQVKSSYNLSNPSSHQKVYLVSKLKWMHIKPE